MFERTAWGDEAATAAEVTALQVFRDLFAAEALRPGEPISVGTLAVAFTDLRGSTRYYRDVGDAPAFGFVLEHLDVLREAVAAEGGSVVKVDGRRDHGRVLARPVSAVRAMQAAQQAVAGRPLALKVGIHSGPCIAVTRTACSTTSARRSTSPPGSSRSRPATTSSSPQPSSPIRGRRAVAAGRADRRTAEGFRGRGARAVADSGRLMTAVASAQTVPALRRAAPNRSRD